MQVDEAKMIQLIASEPMIRTVVLADRLDCDIEDIDDAILPLLNRGRITAHPVTAPNNRKAIGYTLSDHARVEILRSSPGVSMDACATHIERAISFIRTNDTVTGAQLHSHLELDPIQTPSNVLAEAMADGRLFKDGKHWTLGAAMRCAPEAPPAEPQPEVGTKVDRAVAFVKAGGSASDDELRKVMGIEKPYAPAAYLNSAIRNGKLHKNAGMWKPGPASAGGVKEGFSFAKDKGPVAQFKPDVQPEEVADLPDALVAELSKPTQKLVASTAPKPAEQLPVGNADAVRAFDIPPHMVSLTVQPKAAPAPFPVASFRCGLWSDGVLEICRDGKVIAALSPDEVDHVAQFIDRRAA